MVHSWDLIPQKDGLRMTHLSPCSIYEDSLPHDCSIKFKESCYNLEFNTSEFHDDKKLQERCHNVVDGVELDSGNKGAYQVYSVGSEAQRKRSPLSEEICLDLRNSPGSNNMAEDCFESKYLRGVLENYEISAHRIAKSTYEIVGYSPFLISMKLRFYFN